MVQGLERGGQEREDVERESRDELMSSSLKSVKGQILVSAGTDNTLHSMSLVYE